MKEKNLTALMSSFIRAYHNENNNYKIFSDNLAKKVLTKEEYENISNSLISGINFFNPAFVGNDSEALKWIVNNNLSPSVLGRSAFCEKSLKNAIRIGCKQYISFASGYDTLHYKEAFKDLKIFELDKSEMIEDKIKRLDNNKIDYKNITFIKSNMSDTSWVNDLLNSNYSKTEISFSSLLGISYYLTKKEFALFIKNLSNIIPNGSSIIFDYPNGENEESIKIKKLANKANEEMKSIYSYKDIENILSENNLLIYEHLDHNQMTKNFFETFNALNPSNNLLSPKYVSYCLAVKQEK